MPYPSLHGFSADKYPLEIEIFPGLYVSLCCITALRFTLCEAKAGVIRFGSSTQTTLPKHYAKVGSRSVDPPIFSLICSLSSVAGTAEPVYGPEAFQSVLARTKDKNPVSELSPEDYEWTLPKSAHVETSTFYITAETGHAIMCQIIHSKVKFVPLFRG